jgi:hypothetical protein
MIALKRFSLLLMFIVLSITALAQDERHVTLEQGFNYLYQSKQKVDELLLSKGYKVIGKEARSWTYLKDMQGSGFRIIINFKGNVLTAVMWDEFLSQSNGSWLQSEVSKYKAKGFTAKINGSDFKSYESGKRNLMFIISYPPNEIANVMVCLKNASLPYVRTLPLKKAS